MKSSDYSVPVGCPLRGVVAFGLTHYFIYGLFAVIFVFTNYSYPPLYYVDYMYGISGATLIVFSCAGVFMANLKNYQYLRVAIAVIIILNVLLNVVSTFYYTVERWHDVIVTGIIKLLRSPSTRDFPDILWNILVVFACVNASIMPFYLICVMKLFFQKWKSFLFTQPYQNQIRPLYFSRGTINVPTPSTAYQPNK